MPGLALKEVSASVPIRGSLPIIGTAHTINATLPIGTLTAGHSSYDPRSEQTIYVNSSARFSGVTVTAGNQEPILLLKMNWKQNGSASIQDISNVVTVIAQNGIEKEFPTILNPDKRIYATDLGGGFHIDRGQTVQIYVKGTVGLGVGRTIVFDIDDYPDILGIGEYYGYYILTLGGDTTAAAAEGQFSTLLHPFYHGYIHTISSGNFQIGR